MPPSKSQVMAAIQGIIPDGTRQITARPELALLVMRELKTTTSYVEKILTELMADGLLKEIKVDPSGFLSLSLDDRKDIALVYLHPREYGEPVYGSVSLERHNLGHLWKGKAPRSYLTTAAAWTSLRKALVAESKVASKKADEVRADRRLRDQAALEVAVPGYTKTLEELTKLLPDVEIHVAGASSGRENPDVWVTVDGLRVSDLKAIVALVQRGLSAS